MADQLYQPDQPDRPFGLNDLYELIFGRGGMAQQGVDARRKRQKMADEAGEPGPATQEQPGGGARKVLHEDQPIRKNQNLIDVLFK